MIKEKITIAKNPVIWADVPDPDVIRIGNCFYMVSTSMHMMPGCPIMKSEDLVHWEIVNYVFEKLEDNDAHNLMDGKGVYKYGAWVASLRYHHNTFYICFSCNDMNRFYIYQTEDIERGEWRKYVVEGVHVDPCLLFDEDSIYVIYGSGDIYIKELTQDVTSIKGDGKNQLLLSSNKNSISLRCGGCRAYKINGYYYLLFIEWPKLGNWRRRQICYRSEQLLGNYERNIIMDDDMQYHNKGIALGTIFDTPEHDWYAMLFQDHDAVGRVPILQPVTWIDDWPLMGINGTALNEFEVNLPRSPKKSLVISDEFNYENNKLALNWQWNHNPDNDLWSLTERPGYIRLKTGSLANGVLNARNTLTQRTEGPACMGIALMDITNMKPGDRAGLIALQNYFGTVGINVEDNGLKYVVMCKNNGDGNEKSIEKISYDANYIYLKIKFYFNNSIDIAIFEYSENGDTWIEIGNLLKMEYSLKHFMGYRIGLFNYATKEIGGYVDFDFFHFEHL